MSINKRDVVAIIALSIVFFSVATWNLGLTNSPTTVWQTNGSESFHVDLGEVQNLTSVYFLVQSGNASVSVSTGSPGSWIQYATSKTEGYYSWTQLQMGSSSRYVDFDVTAKYSSFSSGSRDIIVLAEIVVLGQDNKVLPIISISSNGSPDPSLSHLVDEQSLVQIPPTYLSSTYFDEIYFVRTAENYLHFQYPYEWTHPPLGKIIQAAGIIALGFSPFSWRIMGVVFATLMIPVIYILGKKLFGTWIGAFSAAFLLTFDFLHFTMGRMGTADTYLVFFSLVSQLLFLIYFKDVLKNGWKVSILPLFLAILCFALSFASKWVAIYGLAAELFLLLILRAKDVYAVKDGLTNKFQKLTDPPFFYLIGFVLVAVAIYFLTYIPDMLAGRSLIDVFNLQFSMYHYHSTLVATHPFSSMWWSWPLMVVGPMYHTGPIWLGVWYDLPNGMVSTIMGLGNPAVWWIGFAAVIIVLERALNSMASFTSAPKRILAKIRSVFMESKGTNVEAKLAASNHGDAAKSPMVESALSSVTKKNGAKLDLPAVFIAVFFFFQWLPYVLISRLTFIYHYYLDVPLLCLASAYIISKVWSKKWGKVFTIAYFVSAVILFLLFYPVISGEPTTFSWINHLKLIKGWLLP
jgi:dolichyl-phosphate-mannose-protein mannosyltransferase